MQQLFSHSILSVFPLMYLFILRFAGPLFVIVEYAPKGNLRDYLRQFRMSSGYEVALGEKAKNGTITLKKLLNFALQVSH